MYPDIDVSTLVRHIGEMSIRSDYFGVIPPMPGARAGISALRRLYPGSAIICITSAGSHPESVRLRRANLASYDIDELVMLPLSANKRDHIARFANGGLMVDDLAKNIDAASGLDITPYLYDSPINQDACDTRYRRVLDWEHLVREVVRGLEQEVGVRPPFRCAV